MKTPFAVEWTMRQAWRATPEAGLECAVVRAGWTADALLVEADLGDRAAFNPAKAFNEVAYTKGDVFEIFVRPETQEAYFEIHITPENQVLQLRFADSHAIRQIRAGRTEEEKLGPYMVWEPRITSETRVDAAAKMWHVRALVPTAMVSEKGPMKPGDRWLCSFCRYDYTQGAKSPILSSTSPHVECNFHRQQEWQPIVFSGV
ncbi:MAG: hypothetical protein IT578_08605 [Verrucomicrobiae bacterium]|nr:hypothetical protein [Verrucomicrobiae bacterium]